MNTLCAFLLFTYILPNIGYVGADKCTSRGYFGTDCKYYCHCPRHWRHLRCDLVTGRCLDPECAHTYSGPSCQQVAADGTCLIGNFGSNCQYICHCGDSRTVCDQMTGECADTESCSSGYHGDNCQIENVALGKYAYQSSDYSFANTARLAVDGDQDPEFDENVSNPKCSRTKSSQADNWWYVDLGEVYPIQRIRIYNRDGTSQDRLSGFQVKVGERRDVYEVCHTDQMSAVPPLVIDVTCDRVIKGRYVRINTGHADQILTLCEVQVFVCADYWYGANCNYTCNCADVNEVCDKHTGECPISGCRQDYGGIDCNECDLDNYGQKCYNSCSSHCNAVTPGYRICHVEHGACTEGCQSGYLPPLCNDECEWGYYGDCATPCSEHCGPILMHGRACNLLTGYCTNRTSCRKGFQGHKCDKECSSTTYGEGCQNNCSDQCITVLPLERVCNHVTGVCASCKPGYKGTNCDQKCFMDYYGDCTIRCSEHCITVGGGQRQCNFVSGDCTNTTGCQPGYIGPKCDQVLKSNTADGDSSSDGGKIAGIVIGCILGIALIAALVIIYRLRKKITTTKATSTTQASHDPNQHTDQDLVHKLNTEEHPERTTGNAADTVIEYETLSDPEGAEYCEITETATKDRGQHGNDIYENSDSVYLTPIHTTI